MLLDWITNPKNADIAEGQVVDEQGTIFDSVGDMLAANELPEQVQEIGRNAAVMNLPLAEYLVEVTDNGLRPTPIGALAALALAFVIVKGVS